MSDPHPLFDPFSDYSRFRRPLVEPPHEHEQLIVYFQRLTRPTTPLPPKQEPEGLAPFRQVVSATDPSRTHENLSVEFFWDGPRRLFSTRVPGGMAWGRDAACRLFIVPLGVQSALRQVANADRWTAAFRPDRIRDNPELARLVSALPDLDGWVDATGEVLFPTIELPAACHGIEKLPDRTALLAVVNGG